MHGVYTHSTFTNSWGNLTLNNSVLNSRSKSELTNHLGNVLSVISDKPIPHDNNGTVDYWQADILVAQDYSPFGVTLSGRNFDLLTTHQNAGGTTTPPPAVAEIYKNNFDTPPATTNPYTGTPTLDDKIISSSWSTPTAGGFTNFNGKTGKAIAITTATPDTSYITLTLTVKDSAELTLDSYSFYHRSSGTGYANYILAVNGTNASSGAIWVSNNNNLHTTGDVSLSNFNGLTGTVQVTLKLFGGTHGSGGTFRMDDFVLNGYVVQNVQNGGGGIARNGYAWGFQGQIFDSETGLYNYTYRMESPRLGRFFSVDPLSAKYPYNSSYAFSENRVIDGIELEGLERVNIGGEWKDFRGMGQGRIEKELGWTEQYHHGLITVERVNEWQKHPNWYITVENQSNYWMKSTGTTMNFYKNREDWLNDKPFKTTTEQTLKQWFFSLGDGSGGKYDPTGNARWGGNKEKDIKSGLTVVSGIITFATGGVSLLTGEAATLTSTVFTITGIGNSIDDLSGINSQDGKTFLQNKLGATGDAIKVGVSLFSAKKDLVDFVKSNKDISRTTSIISFVNDQGNAYYGLIQIGQNEKKGK